MKAIAQQTTDGFQTTFFKLDQSQWKPRVAKKKLCPNCLVYYILPLTNKFVGKCKCGHMHNFFIPFPAQLLTFALENEVIASIGGTGSGKTLGSAYKWQYLMRINPGLKIMAFSGTKQQLEESAKGAIDSFFLKDEWRIKNEDKWILGNNSQIIWWSSKQPSNIRSAEAGGIWVIEASETMYKLYKELVTRVRQNSMKEFETTDKGDLKLVYDKQQKRYKYKLKKEKIYIICETNPDLGWIRQKILLKSHSVFFTQSVINVDKLKPEIKPHVDPEYDDIVSDYVSILYATIDNPTITTNYLTRIKAALPRNEWQQKIYCDLSFSESLVFGAYLSTMFTQPEIVEFPLRGNNIYWVEGLDPGGSSANNDPTGYIIGLMTIRQGTLPQLDIIDGFKISGLTQIEVAHKIKTIRKLYHWSRELSKFFVVDPSANNKDYDQRSYVKDMARFEIFLDSKINRNITFGLQRMNTLFNQKKIKIHQKEGTKSLEEELRNYHYQEIKEVSNSTTKTDVRKPIDKNNHMIDPLRYIVAKMWLIGNPHILKQETETRSIMDLYNDDSQYGSGASINVIFPESTDQPQLVRQGKLVYMKEEN